MSREKTVRAAGKHGRAADNGQAVAEGIEDAATRRALAELGCDVGQGFGLSPPLKPAVFEAWYRQWNDEAATAERGRRVGTQ